MRLFTALWLPTAARTALSAAIRPSPRGSGAATAEPWRPVDPASWHVTLCFHGEADPGVLAGGLDAAVPGRSAPRLRVRGAEAFPGVRWAGVQAEPDAALLALVAAVGGDPAGFVAHVTVRRSRDRRRSAGRPTDGRQTSWAGHVGPWWWPDAVLLVASEPARGGPRYRPVHRVPLARPAPQRPGGDGSA